MNRTKFVQFVFISCLLLSSYMVSAQNRSIQGVIRDSIAKRALNAATVSLVNANDSSLVGFARTNETGNFVFKNIAPGAYLISVSYVGYQPKWIAVTSTNVGNTIDMGILYLNDVNNLSTVTVTARRPPVVINGDSI